MMTEEQKKYKRDYYHTNRDRIRERQFDDYHTNLSRMRKRKRDYYRNLTEEKRKVLNEKARIRYQNRTQEQRDKNNETKRKYRKEHPTKYKNSRLKTVYGITLKQFNQLKREQGGRCKICKNKPKKFVVDHNHKTGKVRGLLCPRCNNLLGMSQDDPRLLQVAIQYLKRFK